MAMCVYNYVFNKHVIVCVWEGGSGADSSIYYIGGALYLRGVGAAYVPSGSRAAPKGGRGKD